VAAARRALHHCLRNCELFFVQHDAHDRSRGNARTRTTIRCNKYCSASTQLALFLAACGLSQTSRQRMSVQASDDTTVLELGPWCVQNPRHTYRKHCKHVHVRRCTMMTNRSTYSHTSADFR
jgi:hypothetical protein